MSDEIRSNMLEWLAATITGRSVGNRIVAGSSNGAVRREMRSASRTPRRKLWARGVGVNSISPVADASVAASPAPTAVVSIDANGNGIPTQARPYKHDL